MSKLANICNELYQKRARICFVIFCIGSFFYAVKTGMALEAKHTGTALKILFPTIFALTTILITSVTGIVFFRSKTLAPQKHFVLLFSTFGILYLLIVPTWATHDAYNHWFRILEISHGHFISAVDPESGRGGQYLPVTSIPSTYPRFGDANDTYASFASDHSRHLQNTQSLWIEFPNIALYSPITYLFHVPGVWLAQLVTDRLFIVSYAGRFSAFIFSLAILYIAVRCIPERKKTFVFLTMSPLFLVESVNLSGDVLINTVLCASVAFTFYYSSTAIIRLSRRDYGLLGLLSFLIALGKIVYLPFVAIFFLIPETKFASKKHRKFFLWTLFILAVLLNIWWLSIAHNFRIGYREGTNSQTQVHFLLNNPVSFALISLKTYAANFSNYVKPILGTSLGLKYIPFNNMLFRFSVICLLCLVLAEPSMKNFIGANKKRYILFGGTILATVAMVTTSLWVQWTRVGSEIIEGIQGRYFIPVIVLFVLALPNIALSFKAAFEKCKFKLCLSDTGILFSVTEKKLYLSVDDIYRAGLLVYATSTLYTLGWVMRFFA